MHPLYHPLNLLGTHGADSTHRVYASETPSQETMFPSAKFVTAVSIDKGIYYATQRKLISRGILPCDPPYTSQQLCNNHIRHD
jgi:hypothetical protein